MKANRKFIKHFLTATALAFLDHSVQLRITQDAVQWNVNLRLGVVIIGWELQTRLYNFRKRR